VLDSTRMKAGEIAARLRTLGEDPSPDAILETQRLYAPFHEAEPYDGVRITRDIAYGGDVRQRFDLFAPEQPSPHPQPMLVFAHGGGYVSGGRRLEFPAYYDNVGVWAVRHGMVAATMSYRLAPESAWPSGADDVGAVVRRLHADAAALHVDPARIYVFGHSAGAAHTASYLAREPAAPIAGAVFASGVYDLARMLRSQNHVSYFGSDPELLAQRSSVAALAASAVPLLVTCAEYDPPKFHVQADILLHALLKGRGRPAPSLCMPGHTHFSQVFQLNADGAGRDYFSSLLAAFIEGTAPASRSSTYRARETPWESPYSGRPGR
jgi:acetyl esterase/lipase